MVKNFQVYKQREKFILINIIIATEHGPDEINIIIRSYGWKNVVENIIDYKNSKPIYLKDHKKTTL